MEGYTNNVSQMLVTSLTLAEEIEMAKARLIANLLIQNRIYYNNLGFWQEEQDYFEFLANELIYKIKGLRHCSVKLKMFELMETNCYADFLKLVEENKMAVDNVCIKHKEYWDESGHLRTLKVIFTNAQGQVCRGIILTPPSPNDAKKE